MSMADGRHPGRRRKARCVYARDADICSNCLKRGSKCAVELLSKEDVVDQRSNVRNRVSKLEDMMASIMQKLGHPSHDGGSVLASPVSLNGHQMADQSSLPLDSSSKIAKPYENLPVQSLLDKALFSERGVHAESPAAESPLPQRHDPLYQEMMSLLPDDAAMQIIFDNTSQWWEIWKATFPHTVTEYGNGSVNDFAQQAIASRRLLPLSRVLVALAVSIEQLPPGFDLSELRLRHEPEILMAECLAVVDRLLNSHEGLASTIEGVEVMVLQANFYRNDARPRKAWLTVRKAVTFANLLGMPYAASTAVSTSSALTRRKRSIWRFLYFLDRQVSFILSLPYSIIDVQSGIDFDDGSDHPVQRFLLRLCRIAGYLVDRTCLHQNGGEVLAMGFDMALQLDEKLEALAKTMLSSWWDRSNAAGLGSLDLLAQLLYYHIRAMNHLPFMLRISENRRYEHSLLTCTQSARDVLSVYSLVRLATGAGEFSCRMLDFQAFIAAVVLLLNLLGDGRHTSPAYQDQAEQDWERICKMIVLLQQAAMELGGVVASQAVAVLETLKARKGAIHAGQALTQIVIPYIGVIKIAGSDFACSARVNQNSCVIMSSNTFELQGESLTGATSIQTRAGEQAEGSCVVAQQNFLGSADTDSGFEWSDLFTTNIDEGSAQDLEHSWYGGDLDQDWNWMFRG